MAIKIKPDVILNEQKIEQDLERFANAYAETIAKEAQKIIERFAKTQMVGYYDEYDPREYDRTYQMRDLSYKPFFNHSGNIYEGGVIIYSGHTYHERHPITSDFTEEDLYENVWIKGSHGFEMVGYKNGWRDTRHLRAILGKPDRLNTVKKKAYSDETMKRLIDKGMKKAKSQSYSIIDFK